MKGLRSFRAGEIQKEEWGAQKLSAGREGDSRSLLPVG